MFSCEAMVILGASFMWNFLLIENLLIGIPIPACFPRMFSKQNDAVVAALIQNLGTKLLMNIFCKSDLATESVHCRMKCLRFLSCQLCLSPKNMRLDKIDCQLFISVLNQHPCACQDFIVKYISQGHASPITSIWVFPFYQE